MHKIYTMPHCDKCEKIKEYLKEHKISFEVVDLGEDDGIAELRKSYVKLKDKVTRTSDGQMPVPLFVSFDAEGNVQAVAHKLEEVKAIFSN